MTYRNSPSRLCPSCGCKIKCVIEVWENYLTFEINELCEVGEEGILSPGFALKVLGHCFECGHQWKLQNIDQISDLKKQWGESNA